MTLRRNDDGVVFSTLATELTTLLAMPVKLEKVGSHVRCLELRLRFSSGDAVYTTVAFRTDEDRQGEDRLVISWRPRIDPPPVSPWYCRAYYTAWHQNLGCTMSLGRKGTPLPYAKATAFVRARGYPDKWWARSWALALLRQGAIAQCLPILLRTALHCSITQTPAQRSGASDQSKRSS